MPSSRQYLLQAADEYEMNEWISLINYASAFKTANIRMRGTAMGKDRAVLAGAAAAASHKRELQGRNTPTENGPPITPRKAVFGDSSDINEKPNDSPPSHLSMTRSRAGTLSKKSVIDIDGAENVVVDEGEKLEEVFDIVKAELAAGRSGGTKKFPEGSGLDEGKERLSGEGHAARSDILQVS